jgi:hypothetical protein
MVDLGWLENVRAPARWDERLRTARLYVNPGRMTVVRDPRFYMRSPGGFGGVHRYEGALALQQGRSVSILDEYWMPIAWRGHGGG